MAKTETFFVYMVRCRNGTLYTGTARDVKKRVLEHNQGKGAKYTRAFGPVELVWKKRFKNRSRACSEESRIKRLSRNEKNRLYRIFPCK